MANFVQFEKIIRFFTIVNVLGFIYNLAFCFDNAYQELREEFKSEQYLNSFKYEEKYKNIAQNFKDRTGVIVIAFNRPEDFIKLLNSIEANEESKTLPFYFILEGGPKAKQKENIELIEKSKILNKSIILRNRNFGLVKNHIDAKRFMFDWCGFERVIIIEEDLLLSPYYFRLLLNFDNWARENFDNIGAVSCWSYCFLNNTEKENKLNWIRSSCPDWWWSFVTYCINKAVWDEIKPILYKYEAFVDEIPHTDEFTKARSKPSTWVEASKIKDWVKNIAKLKVEKSSEFNSISKKQFTAHELNQKIFKEFVTKHNFYWGCLNQDSMMAFSLWMRDYVKLETIVNRVQHIGQDNSTSILSEADKNELNLIKCDIFSEDKNINNFKVVSC